MRLCVRCVCVCGVCMRCVCLRDERTPNKMRMSNEYYANSSVCLSKWFLLVCELNGVIRKTTTIHTHTSNTHMLGNFHTRAHKLALWTYCERKAIILNSRTIWSVFWMSVCVCDCVSVCVWVSVLSEHSFFPIAVIFALMWAISMYACIYSVYLGLSPRLMWE